MDLQQLLEELRRRQMMGQQGMAPQASTYAPNPAGMRPAMTMPGYSPMNMPSQAMGSPMASGFGMQPSSGFGQQQRSFGQGMGGGNQMGFDFYGRRR